MANTTILRIKRSTTAGNPAKLGEGELAYSAANYTTTAGGGRLYIGIGAETGGDAASHLVIGGEYFTDKLDHAPGTLTENSALIADADKKLDNLKVDNLDFNGNTISSTDVNGNIVLAPNGSGLISANSTRIVNLANPVLAQDAVTRNYIESGNSNVYFNNIDAAGDLQIDGNLIVGGTTTTLSAQNLAVADNMIYLNQGIEVNIANAIGDGTFITYETVENHNYVVGMNVTITGCDPVNYDITGAGLAIIAVSANTFTVAKVDGLPYVSGGIARARTSTNPDLGWAAGYNDGTYAHAGWFRDASDGRFKAFEGYIPEPDADVFIDTTHASFALADIQAENFHGELIGNASTAAQLQTSRNISIAGDATGTQSFNGSADAEINITLADTAVTPGSYGSSTEIPTFTVDSKGRLTAAGVASVGTTLLIHGDEDPESSAPLQVSLLTDTLTFVGGTGITTQAISGNNSADDQLVINLDNTAVTANPYGAADTIPTFTVDAQGRLIAAADVAIDILSSQISDFNEAAQDAIGLAIAAGVKTNITVTYDDLNSGIDFSVATATSSVLGVAKFSTDNFLVSAGNVTVVEVDGGSYV
jgi:hypothetical protein